MKMERKTLRIGAAVIGCAVLLRLFGGSVLGGAVQALRQPQVASFILFLETGRILRPAQASETTEPPQTQPQETGPTGPDQQEPDLPVVFTSADAELIELHNSCGYEADIAAMLQEPLTWDLTQDGPAVLILHTHGTESFTNTENYEESSSYRTLDENYNMVSIGQRVAERLEAGGIQVLHDRQLHDKPSYNGAYTQSRESVQRYLEKYPSIRLVLDLHRDAIEDSSGNQVGYTLKTDAGTAAKLMLVMGTDAGGLYYPNWRENLSLAVKLQAQLEKNNPGSCRPMSFRSSRFNQDLTPGAVLVEVGAAGNTRQEALVAADLLAQAILDLAHGSVGG